jgi:hypothetical protein
MNSIQHQFRNRVSALEGAMLELPQAEIPVSHSFCGGMCARTIEIKAGTILTGAIHTQEQLNIVQGDITIITEEGERRYTGFHVIPSPAGTKRVGYAHADTVWTTILKTDETEIEKVEALVTNRFDDQRLPQNKIIELEGN